MRFLKASRYRVAHSILLGSFRDDEMCILRLKYDANEVRGFGRRTKGFFLVVYTQPKTIKGRKKNAQPGLAGWCVCFCVVVVKFMGGWLQWEPPCDKKKKHPNCQWQLATVRSTSAGAN